MGIPSYFKNLIDTYKEKTYSHIQDIDIDELYFDANSIIYDCLRDYIDAMPSRAQALYNIKQDYTILFDAVKNRLETYIKNINPSSIVFISFDGVVPLAKMKQQRERRFKGVITSELEQKINKLDMDNDTEKQKESYNPDELFSTVEITPGTPFMNELNSYFENCRLDINSSITIIWCLSNSPGEGEHKICEYIRENINDAKVAIYGLDADLFVLSLQHLDFRNNIHLVRELPEYDTALNEIYKENEYVCVNINELAKQIYIEMIPNTGYSPITKKQYIKDYVFLTFFAGNDFLPHIFGLSLRRCGFDLLLDYYRELQSKNDTHNTLVSTDGEINWGYLQEYLELLSNDEHKLVKDEYDWLKKCGASKLRRWTTYSTEEKVLHYPHLNREKEDFISVHNKNWEQRYYQMCFQSTPYHTYDFRKMDTIIKNMCWNYFQGLYWVLQYYTGHGNVQDIAWKYDYHEAPLLSSLFKHVPLYQMDMFPENMKLDIDAISTDTQLCYVLPPKYHHIIPTISLRKLYIECPEAQYCNGSIDTFLKNYFWESSMISVDFDFKKLNTRICET